MPVPHQMGKRIDGYFIGMYPTRITDPHFQTKEVRVVTGQEQIFASCYLGEQLTPIRGACCSPSFFSCRPEKYLMPPSESIRDFSGQV